MGLKGVASVMRPFKATNPNIIYIDNRTDCDGAKVATFNCCKFFIMFKGAALTLTAEGDPLCSVDGGD